MENKLFYTKDEMKIMHNSGFWAGFATAGACVLIISVIVGMALFS